MIFRNPEERKAYQKRYHEAHKEEQRAYRKKYYETHKEERQAYLRKYRVTKYYGYGGVCVCPKCGKKGYKQYDRPYNKKTGNYGSISTRVDHQHTEKGKTVHDGCCFIGKGKL